MTRSKPKKRPKVINGKWLTTDGLAENYGIAHSTQSKYRKDRIIPFKKIGGIIYYAIDEIDKWIDQHSVVEVRA